MEEGTFDPSIPYNLEAARFSFMGILQNKLDKTVNSWNNHCVRSVRNTECPEVRPHVLYYLPGEDGTSDCSFPVSLNGLIIAQLHSRQASILGCSDDMVKLGQILFKKEKHAMIHLYLFKIIFSQYVAMASIKASLPLICKVNQDNDFNKLCLADFLLMVLLCFYFQNQS